MLDLAPFDALPDDADVWVRTADAPFSPAQQAALLDGLAAFFPTWRSHGRVVRGAATVAEGRFLVAAGVTAPGDLSGCGKDALAREIDRLAEAAGVRWADPLAVAYRGVDGAVRVVGRRDLRDRIAAGDVLATTGVFDPSVANLGALRADPFERPAAATWVATRLPATV